MTSVRSGCELSPSLRASLPMLHASVAKPGSQFAGMSLENFERLVETNEKIRASFEAFVARFFSSLQLLAKGARVSAQTRRQT